MKTKLILVLAFLVTHFFTAAWAAEVVIPDAALKSAIWQALGRPLPVGSLTEQDMLSLTNLDGVQNVKSLEGLGAAHNLTTLDLSYNQLTNLRLPAGLTSLTTLNLEGNRLTNLTSAAELPSLTTLDLGGNADLQRLNQLADFSFLSGSTNLTTLNLSYNALKSLTLPAGLTSLTTLNLAGNQLRNLTSATGLPSLTTLDLSGFSSYGCNADGYPCYRWVNQLADFSFLRSTTNLTIFRLGYNDFTSLTLPDGLTSLTTLILDGNPLQSFVLPEALANGALAGLVAQLVSQGVSVSIYLPTLRLVALPRTMGENFDLLLTGPPGTYRLQVTRDFSTWTELDPVTVDANGFVKVTDPSANARPHSFYRAVRLD